MTQQSNGQNLVVQGRIVWGVGSSLFEGKQKTDYNTNQVVYGADGQPVVEYGFGLAIPKIDPATGQAAEEFTKIWNALHQEAFTLFPSGQIPPGFAMKYKDGDGVDHNGKPYADKEGYAGHIVLACTTRIPVKWFKFEGGNNILVSDGIKVGDYVNVQLNIKAHPAKGQGKAGLYLNPSAVQLIQAGKEIINAPSGDQIFGAAAPSYTGQVVADTAPAMPGQAPAPVMPGQAPAMPGQAPAMPGQAPAMPTADPHYGVLPGNMQPPTQAAVTVPAMPAQGNVPATPTQATAPMVNGGVPPVTLSSANGMMPAVPMPQ